MRFIISLSARWRWAAIRRESRRQRNALRHCFEGPYRVPADGRCHRCALAKGRVECSLQSDFHSGRCAGYRNDAAHGSRPRRSFARPCTRSAQSLRPPGIRCIPKLADRMIADTRALPGYKTSMALDYENGTADGDRGDSRQCCACGTEARRRHCRRWRPSTRWRKWWTAKLRGRNELCRGQGDGPRPHPVVTDTLSFCLGRFCSTPFPLSPGASARCCCEHP